MHIREGQTSIYAHGGKQWYRIMGVGGWAWWYIPVYSAIQEIEVGGSWSEAAWEKAQDPI
jgi:hypothetical protein